MTGRARLEWLTLTPGAMWTMVGDREQHIRAVLAKWEQT